MLAMFRHVSPNVPHFADYESGGRGFESFPVRHSRTKLRTGGGAPSGARTLLSRGLAQGSSASGDVPFSVSFGTVVQRADTLSGGQQQQVAIARAIAQESRVLAAMGHTRTSRGRLELPAAPPHSVQRY